MLQNQPPDKVVEHQEIPLQEQDLVGYNPNPGTPGFSAKPNSGSGGGGGGSPINSIQVVQVVPVLLSSHIPLDK